MDFVDHAVSLLVFPNVLVGLFLHIFGARTGVFACGADGDFTAMGAAFLATGERAFGVLTLGATSLGATIGRFGFTGARTPFAVTATGAVARVPVALNASELKGKECAPSLVDSQVTFLPFLRVVQSAE
jgi:hypothetical protein